MGCLDILGFYAGPDQVMTMTSGIAGVIGVLLMFWNKAAGALMKVIHELLSTTPEAAAPPRDISTPQA